MASGFFKIYKGATLNPRSDQPTGTGGDVYADDGTNRTAGLYYNTAGTWALLTAALTPTVDVFSGNGSTTAFTLSVTPGTNKTSVHISGVYQHKATYSVSGTTLTFTQAPPTGSSNIEVVSN